MRTEIPAKTAQFIQALPKTETHLHIEGSFSYDLMRKLDPVKYKDDPHCWAPDFQFECFEDFENHLLAHATQWFTTPERYHEAAKVMFAGHLEQNVRYVETSFHAGIIDVLGIPGPEILDAILSAVPQGLEVRVFMGMARNAYRNQMVSVLEDCVNWKGLSGIDLHGIEYLPLEDWTPRLWAKAREAGLETKVHAGEFGPSGHVSEAIELLGSRRIQHGIHAIDDPKVMDLILEADATLDVCPISNVKLKVVESMDVHPIRAFFDKGIRCTISTDDMFSFGNIVNDEYVALSANLDFTHAELAQLAKNGFHVALVDDAQRAEWVAEVDACLADFS